MKKAWIVAVVVLGVVALVAIGLLIGGGLWLRGHALANPRVAMGWWRHLRGVGLLGGELLRLALFGVVGGAIALLVASLMDRRPKAATSEPTALDILKRRYASGEIDREEFERMRQEVGG